MKFTLRRRIISMTFNLKQHKMERYNNDGRISIESFLSMLVDKECPTNPERDHICDKYNIKLEDYNNVITTYLRDE